MTGEQVRIPADFLRLLKPLAEQAVHIAPTAAQAADQA